MNKVTYLYKYTSNGEEPIPVPRIYEGEVYKTFTYPMNGGVEVAIMSDNGWYSYKWYNDWCSFSDKWKAVRE